MGMFYFKGGFWVNLLLALFLTLNPDCGNILVLCQGNQAPHYDLDIPLLHSYVPVQHGTTRYPSSARQLEPSNLPFDHLSSQQQDEEMAWLAKLDKAASLVAGVFPTYLPSGNSSQNSSTSTYYSEHISRTVVVTIANMGYLSHLRNFACFANRINLHFLVLAVDDLLVERLQGSKHSQFEILRYPGFYTSESMSVNLSSGSLAQAAGFQSEQFNLISLRKFEAVYDLLRLGYDVLFVDVDVVLLQNMFHQLLRSELKNVAYMHSMNQPCTSHGEDKSYFLHSTRRQPNDGNTGFHFLQHPEFARNRIIRFYDSKFPNGATKFGVPRPKEPIGAYYRELLQTTETIPVIQMLYHFLKFIPRDSQFNPSGQFDDQTLFWRYLRALRWEQNGNLARLQQRPKEASSLSASSASTSSPIQSGGASVSSTEAQSRQQRYLRGTHAAADVARQTHKNSGKGNRLGMLNGKRKDDSESQQQQHLENLQQTENYYNYFDAENYYAYDYRQAAMNTESDFEDYGYYAEESDVAEYIESVGLAKPAATQGAALLSTAIAPSSSATKSTLRSATEVQESSVRSSAVSSSLAQSVNGHKDHDAAGRSDRHGGLGAQQTAIEPAEVVEEDADAANFEEEGDAEPEEEVNDEEQNDDAESQQGENRPADVILRNDQPHQPHYHHHHRHHHEDNGNKLTEEMLSLQDGAKETWVQLSTRPVEPSQPEENSRHDMNHPSDGRNPTNDMNIAPQYFDNVNNNPTGSVAVGMGKEDSNEQSVLHSPSLGNTNDPGQNVQDNSVNQDNNGNHLLNSNGQVDNGNNDPNNNHNEDMNNNNYHHHNHHRHHHHRAAQQNNNNNNNNDDDNVLDSMFFLSTGKNMSTSATAATAATAAAVPSTTGKSDISFPQKRRQRYLRESLEQRELLGVMPGSLSLPSAAAHHKGMSSSQNNNKNTISASSKRPTSQNSGQSSTQIPKNAAVPVATAPSIPASSSSTMKAMKPEASLPNVASDKKSRVKESRRNYNGNVFGVMTPDKYPGLAQGGINNNNNNNNNNIYNNINSNARVAVTNPPVGGQISSVLHSILPTAPFFQSSSKTRGQENSKREIPVASPVSSRSSSMSSSSTPDMQSRSPPPIKSKPRPAAFTVRSNRLTFGSPLSATADMKRDYLLIESTGTCQHTTATDHSTNKSDFFQSPGVSAVSICALNNCQFAPASFIYFEDLVHQSAKRMVRENPALKHGYFVHEGVTAPSSVVSVGHKNDTNPSSVESTSVASHELSRENHLLLKKILQEQPKKAPVSSASDEESGDNRKRIHGYWYALHGNYVTGEQEKWKLMQQAGFWLVSEKKLDEKQPIDFDQCLLFPHDE